MEIEFSKDIIEEDSIEENLGYGINKLKKKSSPISYTVYYTIDGNVCSEEIALNELKLRKRKDILNKV